MPTDPVILVIMVAAALTIVRFWRKVLALMLSVAIAVFFYGVVTLSDLFQV
ncbi:MAG: hypothetical protein ABW022_09940 [Actinoplanes sp.]